jgi:hypothetical protein
LTLAGVVVTECTVEHEGHVGGRGPRPALPRVGGRAAMARGAGRQGRWGRRRETVHHGCRDFVSEDRDGATASERLRASEEAAQGRDARVSARRLGTGESAQRVDGAAATLCGAVGPVPAPESPQPTGEGDGVDGDSGKSQGGRVGEPLARLRNVRVPSARGLSLPEGAKQLWGEAGPAKVLGSEIGEKDTGSVIYLLVHPGLGGTTREQRGAMALPVPQRGQRHRRPCRQAGGRSGRSGN